MLELIDLSEAAGFYVFNCECSTQPNAHSVILFSISFLSMSLLLLRA